MSSESSSDGTHDSASFSSEGSEISSIPSLTELGRAAAASSSASDSDSDSNPFGELESDSASETTEASTGAEDEEGQESDPLAVRVAELANFTADPARVANTVAGLSPENRAAMAAAVGIEPEELATHIQHVLRETVAAGQRALSSRSQAAQLSDELTAMTDAVEAAQLADEVIAEADEGGLDDDEGDSEEDSSSSSADTPPLPSRRTALLQSRALQHRTLRNRDALVVRRKLSLLNC